MNIHFINQAAAYNSTNCIHHLLENSASFSPDHIAAIFRNIVLTYNQFNSYSNQLAHKLVESGIKKDDFVAVSMERSHEMVIAIFAILKAGGAYVPIDPSHPKERIHFLLKDAAVKVVITQKRFSHIFEEVVPEIIIPDISQWDFDGFPSTNPDVDVLPSDLAYMLYTSGSTGKPKGVLVEHHSVVNLVWYIQNTYPITEEDKVLLKSPYTFDGSVWELFGWMLPGSSLYIAEPGIEKDPSGLVRIISENKLSFAFFVSSMLSAFLDYVEVLDNPQLLSSLKWVSVGGEVVSPVLIKRFYKAVGKHGAGLFNVYGPTETTVYATTHLFGRDIKYEKAPVGRAVDNDFIYIVDQSLQQVPYGSEGEICIGGEGVARGYFNRPELDAERFVQNPFREGERMYRTGDIGRFLDDHVVDFIGRLDFQVKLRGLRIELGEIEYALFEIGGYKELAVVFSKDRFGDDSLIAYLVPENQEINTNFENYSLVPSEIKDEITRKLLNFLPEYMIPSEFVICRKFPVNENGKLDRKMLPEVMVFYKNDDALEFIPQTSTESQLLQIWKEILGKQKIRPDEDFFSAGGHSLKAIQVITSVIRTFDIELPLNVFYQKPTLKSLSDIIDLELRKKTRIESVDFGIDDESGPFPLSGAQMEMWILNNLDPSGLIHNIQIEFTISGKPDLSLLALSLKNLVNSEEMLRSVFPFVNGKPAQEVKTAVNFDIPMIDLSVISETEKHFSYEQFIKENGAVRFDLGKLPLFSFKLVKLAEEQYRLLFAIHHIIFDGWSLQLFVDRLNTAMNQHGTITRDSVFRNRDYVKWVNNRLDSGLAENQYNYWQSVFKSLPANLTLPKREPLSGKVIKGSGNRKWWSVSEETTRSIHRICHELNTTPFVFLLASFQIVLSRFSGQKDIVVGTPFANRKHPVVTDLIGYYTNMIAIRSEVNPAKTFKAFINEVNQMSIDGFSNSDLAFGEIVKKLGIKPQHGIHPLFQTIFVLQNWPEINTVFPGFSLKQKEIGNFTSKADITFNAENVEGKYVFWFEYDTSLYDDSLIDGMVSSFSNVLEKTIQNPLTELNALIHDVQGVSAKKIFKSCVLIGETTLLQQCGEILLEHGFSINAVITPDINCEIWAKGKQIPLISGYPQAEIILSSAPDYDYLFSIVNSKILPEKILRIAQVANINYHDSLLPAYAGINAGSWAIINGEKQHGITWHIMDAGTDTGDILIQSSFPVENENAFLLNAISYQNAITTFKKLVPLLADKTFIPAKQNRNNASYFGLNKKPFAGGFLDFKMPAIRLNRLVKGLNMGKAIPNYLASPKILINKQLYVVSSSEAEKTKQPGVPGKISGISEKFCEIMTTEGILKITGLTRSNGQAVNLADAFSGMAINDHIQTFDDRLFEDLEKGYHDYGKYEIFWSKQLALMQELPFERQTTRSFSNKKDIFHYSGIQHISSENLPGLIVLFYAILSNTLQPEFGISNDSLNQLNINSQGIFAEVVPLKIKEIKDEWVGSALRGISEQYRSFVSKGSYSIDLISRVPGLSEKYSDGLLPDYRCVIFEGEHLPEEFTLQHPGTLIFQITKKEVIVHLPENQYFKALNVPERLKLFIDQVDINTDTLLSEVNLLSDADKIIHDNLNMNIREPEYKNVISLIRQVAEANPGSIAIEGNQQKITYAELLKKVRIASSYINAHFQKEKIIPICLERSPDLIILLIAILESGRAYLPLDTKFPNERIAAILANSGCNVVITSPKFIESFPYGIHKAFVEQVFSTNTILRENPFDISSDDPAYIIYTSGTTGKPKGVIISNQALSIFTLGTINRYQISNDDRMLQFASISFDASVEEIFPTLCSGACLVLRTDDSISSIDRFIRFINDNQISIIDLPTAFWNQMVQTIKTENLPAPSCLKTVIIGGEKAIRQTVESWVSSLWNEISLFNTYGPTETTVVATSYLIKKDCTEGEVPIGKPVEGAITRVVNVFNQPAIPEQEGRLLIGGGILSSGYVNNPELTHKMFKSFYGKYLNGLFYDTGDLVFINRNGQLIFTGRNDDQLKIRGFRVEPEEISIAVKSLITVIDCFVVPWSREKLPINLIAYVIPVNNMVRAEDIMNSLSGMLPEYMVPSQIIMIDSVPLTINGKVDYKKLPAPGLINMDNKEFINPSTPYEVMLYKIWSKHLGVENFGIDDDFFRLGGHSLIAVGIIGEFEKETGKEIPLASLFSFPTIRTLANAIEVDNQADHWRPLVVIKKGKTGKLPLFLIHGGGLNVLLFNSLANHMNADQPIYGIQAQGLDGKSEPYDDIEDIVRHYISEIESVWPKGPYALAGYSIGGLIAYELACRFLSIGRDVVFVGMFDTVACLCDEDCNGLVRMVRKLKFSFMKVLFATKLIVFSPRKTIPLKWRWIQHKIKVRFLGKQGVNRQDLMDLPLQYARIAKANIKAISKLKLKHFSGTLHLFRSANRSFYVEDKQFLGWKELVDKIEVIELKGDHSRMFAPPNDHDFARKLQACIEDVSKSSNFENDK